MKFPLVEVPVSEICWNDSTYRMSYFRDTSFLIQSLEKGSLVNPPVVQKITQGFRIVSGFRRIEALKKLGHSTIIAYLLPGQKPSLDFFEQLLHENQTVRSFHLIEKAYILQNLVTVFQVEESLLKPYASILLIPETTSEIYWIRNLTKLPKQIQQFIAYNAPSREWIIYCQTLSAEDQTLLIDITLELKLGKSRQKELTFYIKDILKLKNLSFKEYISSPSFKQLLQESSMTYSQKTERFFEKLKEERYPLFSSVKKDFDQWKKNSGIPQQIVLKQDQFFEASKWFCSFEFRDSQQFEKLTKEFAKIKVELEKWEKTFNNLSCTDKLQQ